MTKLKDVDKVKNKIQSSNIQPQTISREAYLKARANLDAMCLNTTEDAFLFYSSINLLNAYVKQNRGKISYDFKKYVQEGFDSIIMNKIENATYSYDPVEKALLVNINGIQFSFHNVEPSAKMVFAKNFENKLDRPYCVEEKWEGIRLQPVAESLFNFANGLDGLSNESIAGNLKDLQNDYVINELNNDKEF